MTQLVEIPRIGFGTYGRTGAEGQAAISHALEFGYRHLDTAQTYGTEAETGAALRESGLARDSVFVTTKVTDAHYAPGGLAPSLRKSCDTLGLDQVDLALLHWPAPRGERPLAEYLLQLAEAQEAGLTRMIGVSNFPIAMLQEAEDLVGAGRIATNQVECNILFKNRIITNYCRDKKILVTCYQPVAQGLVGQSEIIRNLAEELGATPGQVALAWCLNSGHAAIPTSSRPERIAENFAAAQLRLTETQMARIAAIPAHPRSIDPDWGPDWDAA